MGVSTIVIPLLYPFISLIRFVRYSVSLSSEPSKLYDTTTSWKRLLDHRENFIEVLDIPFFPTEATKLVFKATNIQDYGILKDLPAQKAHYIRVYFMENISDDTEKSLIETTSLASSPAMVSQWDLSPKKIHWKTHSYRVLLEPTLKEEIGMNAKCPYIDSVSIAAGTIRRTLRCMIVSTQDGRIIFYIDAKSMVQELDLLFEHSHLKEHQLERPTWETAFAYHSDFCKNLRNPIEAYSVLDSNVTPVSGIKQLLLLRYSHALVTEYTDSVYRLQANYARKKEGLSDPRRVSLTIPMLSEITRDICFYEELKEQTVELAGAVDTLIESLKIHLVDTANYRNFQCFSVEIQSTCIDLKRTINLLSTTLEDHLRLFELSQGIHEAQNVRLLSILASIFLPLSLASGLLSMQTRFSNLHYLLYDFFGVLVLLGTIVAVILIALRLYLWWKRLISQLDRNRTFRRHVRPTAHILFLFCLFLGWGLLISSFLVGMIKDVGLGLKILGYGAFAVVGVGLVIIAVPAGMLLMITPCFPSLLVLTDIFEALEVLYSN